MNDAIKWLLLKIFLWALPGILIVGTILFLITLAFVSTNNSTNGGIGGGSASWSEIALQDIPADYRLAYERGAEKYKLDGPFVLAGIGKIETDHGRLKAPGVTSGVNAYGCCSGPMQFMISVADGCRTSCYQNGSSTWDAYGEDGDGDGVLNVYDIDDAAMGAAAYTSANGAPKDWKRAIWAYNHSEAYRADVMEWAEKYRGAGTAFVPNAGGLIWPAIGPVVSPFGPRWGRMHEGVDIAIPTGTQLLAVAPGKIAYSGVMSGYGNVIDVDHGNGFSTRYAHQSKLIATVGQVVAQGQLIGISGCTGTCFGPHVHFETRVSGAAKDPMGYLPKR